MFPFSILSFRAMVKITEEKVVIGTNIVLMLLTLFLRFRMVEVNCVKQTVTITIRTFYFIKTKTVFPFADIQCFSYSVDEFNKLQVDDYDDMYGEMARYSPGKYTIAILLKDGHKYPIAEYYGSGNGSVELTNILSDSTSIPVNKQLSKIIDYKDLLICADCGRSTKNTLKKCQYCGGQLC